jgi:hypothetical protein
MVRIGGRLLRLLAYRPLMQFALGETHENRVQAERVNRL